MSFRLDFNVANLLIIDALLSVSWWQTLVLVEVVVELGSELMGPSHCSVM